MQFAVFKPGSAKSAINTVSAPADKLVNQLNLPVVRRSEDDRLLNRSVTVSDPSARGLRLPMALINDRRQAINARKGTATVRTFPTSPVVATKSN